MIDPEEQNQGIPPPQQTELSTNSSSCRQEIAQETFNMTTGVISPETPVLSGATPKQTVKELSDVSCEPVNAIDELYGGSIISTPGTVPSYQPVNAIDELYGRKMPGFVPSYQPVNAIDELYGGNLNFSLLDRDRQHDPKFEGYLPKKLNLRFEENGELKTCIIDLKEIIKAGYSIKIKKLELELYFYDEDWQYYRDPIEYKNTYWNDFENWESSGDNFIILRQSLIDHLNELGNVLLGEVFLRITLEIPCTKCCKRKKQVDEILEYESLDSYELGVATNINLEQYWQTSKNLDENILRYDKTYKVYIDTTKKVEGLETQLSNAICDYSDSCNFIDQSPENRGEGGEH